MSAKPVDEKAVFNIARQIQSPDARTDYVRQACGNDHQAMSRVIALLVQHDNTLGFLEKPAVRNPTLGQATPVPAGTRIGPYKLLQRLGEGGMGTVWMAEQEKPVRRMVALKLIKSGLDNRQIVARFEAERQALAMMEHPNIARVLDAGTTPDGQPYFVMDLVRGIPITDYCNQNKLSINERLELYAAVCNAVQHAHQKGILHRDLKPANVLVAQFDGKPVPKIIDFGLAKALQHLNKLTDTTLFTEFGQVVGSLQYMSPEQAELNQLDLDTRTDIYSLGVILYELLTGSTPLEKEELQKAAILKVLETIREKDPPRPSVRLSSSTQAAVNGISEQRRIEPEKLKSLLRGDLDWIVMKALEKDRGRRYPTAQELAEEIRRLLSGDPVRARPPSIGYVVSKYVRKHRGPILAFGAIASLLVLGLAATNWFRIQAATHKQVADTQTAKVNVETQRAIQTELELLAEKKIAEQKATEAASARQKTYAAHMVQAQAAWEIARLDETLRLLEMYRPPEGESGGPDDLRGFEWYYLDRATHAYLTNIQGDGGAYISVAYSPDGKRIASCAENNEVKIWDSVSGQMLLTLKGHTTVIMSVAFSPNGKWLASASSHPENVVKIWDATNGTELRTLKGHTETVTFVAFSPDSTQLASTSNDRTIKVWNVEGGIELHTMKEHNAQVHSAAFSPTGKQLATASADGTVKLWDVAKAEVALTFDKHSTWVYGVAFSPDGKRIASASGDKTVMIWDAETGAIHRTLEGHTDQVNGVAFSPDGTRLASASVDRTVRVWETNYGAPVSTLKGHTGPVTAVAFSTDGQHLASVGGGSVKVWDTTIRKEPVELEIGGFSLAFCPDGKRLSNGRVMYDTSTGESLVTFRGHSETIIDLAISPDGDRVATASFDKTIKIWDAANGMELLTLAGHNDGASAVAFSPDGKQVASGSYDRTIKIWDVESGKLLRTLHGHTGSVVDLAFSPDGQRLASAGEYPDNTARLWDATNGEVVGTLLGHEYTVHSVTFSQDGKWLASAGMDGIIKIWDASKWRLAQELKGHLGRIHCVAFSPDSKRLASASEDRSLKVWDLATGQQTLTFSPSSEGGSGFTCVEFSPDGTRLAAAGFYPITIWNATPRGVGSEKPLAARNESPTVDRSNNKSTDPKNESGVLTAPFSPAELKGAQEFWEEKLRLEVKPKNDLGIELTLIPPGAFEMGSPEAEAGRDPNEGQHWVRLTKPYFMGVTEVSQAQWKAVMGTVPWEGQFGVREGDDYAATHVSWFDACKFCNKLSDMMGIKPFYQISGDTITILGGNGYRLPTEAEWEFACRGGTNTAYSFGNERTKLSDYAWHEGNCSDTVGLGATKEERFAHRVRQKSPNALGLFDMHGNVWEWCWDWWALYPESLQKDPMGPESSFGERVIRGGSWALDWRNCRSAARDRHSPSGYHGSLGFRIAMNPNGQD